MIIAGTTILISSIETLTVIKWKLLVAEQDMAHVV